jgi:hypothetical protein
MRLFDLLPKAVKVLESALESEDERVRVATAKLLVHSYLLNPGVIEHTMEMVKRGAPEADGRMRYLLILGELTDLALKKRRPLDVSGPPELDQLEQAANSQCEIERPAAGLPDVSQPKPPSSIQTPSVMRLGRKRSPRTANAGAHPPTRLRG